MSDADRASDPSATPAHPAVPPVPPVPPVPSAPPAQGPIAPAPVYGYAPPQPPGYAQQPASQSPGYAPPAAPGQAPAPQQPVGYTPPQMPPSQGHPAPGYPAQGYPAQGYPAGTYPAAVPPRGLLPWALGLLILIPFPFVGGLASGIAMAVSGGTSRRFGGVAGENARAAANWGLTYLLVSTVLLISHFVILFSLTADSPSSGFYPIGIPITIWFALSVTHIVLSIVGLVKASRGVVFKPVALPFFSPRRHLEA